MLLSEDIFYTSSGGSFTLVFAGVWWSPFQVSGGGAAKDGGRVSDRALGEEERVQGGMQITFKQRQIYGSSRRCLIMLYKLVY